MAETSGPSGPCTAPRRRCCPAWPWTATAWARPLPDACPPPACPARCRPGSTWPASTYTRTRARPSWAVLWPAGWGPRPHPREARCPCPLTSPSAPPPPATCPWCSCGLPMPTKVRSMPGGGAGGCWAIALPLWQFHALLHLHSHGRSPGYQQSPWSQMVSASSCCHHRAFARAVRASCAPPPAPGWLLLSFEARLRPPPSSPTIPLVTAGLAV